MRLEAALQGHLAAFPSITAVIGSRVYPLLLPQNVVYPAISYQRITGQTIQSNDGDSKLGYSRIQITAWAATYAESRELAAEIRTALIGFKGLMGAVWITGVTHEIDVDLYDNDTKTFYTACDYTIWYFEP